LPEHKEQSSACYKDQTIDCQTKTATKGLGKVINKYLSLRSKPPLMAEERKQLDGKAQAAAAAEGAGSLDKVREILFGSQARDYEKRFAKLEERLIKESSDLKDEVRRRFDSLETYIKNELDAISDRVKAEHGERQESDNQIARDLNDLTKAFEKKSSQLDDQIGKNQRDIREQLLDQSKKLSDDIRQKHEDALASLERESRELRLDKTDRATLASMFTELAMRLNNEFTIPGAEDLDND
jgi:hypothetical protein